MRRKPRARAAWAERLNTMFADLPLWMNVAILAAAAAVVWLAGTRLCGYADAIQKRTGMGEALVGMLLLGLITALPEAAVTVTASYAGSPRLAVNNLLGGMALNVAILAAADAAIRREALTAAVATTLPLLQGALLVLMLAIVAAATVAGDRAVFGIGLWAWLLLAVYFLCVVTVRRARGREGWVPNGMSGPGRAATVQTAGGGAQPSDSLRRLAGKTALGAAAILAAGYAIARSGDALAEQTGLGQSFFGAVFLALTTSLPEMTIVFASVRLGHYAMAISDIFGANLFGLALLFVVDAVYQGEPALADAGRFATFSALLGIAVTALFIAGLLERRHAMILNMGVDSLLVIGVYLSGITVLYGLR